MKYTLDFLGGSIGNIIEYDVQKKEETTNLNFSYEMKSDDLVETDLSIMKISYKFGKDDEGLYRMRVGQGHHLYRKIEN